MRDLKLAMSAHCISGNTWLGDSLGEDFVNDVNAWPLRCTPASNTILNVNCDWNIYRRKKRSGRWGDTGGKCKGQMEWHWPQPQTARAVRAQGLCSWPLADQGQHPQDKEGETTWMKEFNQERRTVRRCYYPHKSVENGLADLEDWLRSALGRRDN